MKNPFSNFKKAKIFNIIFIVNEFSLSLFLGITKRNFSYLTGKRWELVLGNLE